MLKFYDSFWINTLRSGTTELEELIHSLGGIVVEEDFLGLILSPLSVFQGCIYRRIKVIKY